MGPMTEGAADENHILLDGVRMAFGERPVFERLSCGFPRAKISVILGGSGSGKSTALRLIAGLVRPQAGRVLVDGNDVTRLSERRLYGVRQKIGMMFQGGALLDSMTVFDNLALPLREHTWMSEAEIAREVHARLESVGLADVDDLLPGQLSGGMTKRAALARAIIRNPVILLCDEPFSGLDPISTRRIESLLEGINDRNGMTIVAVSHHIPSTMRMAERVLVLLPDSAVAGTPSDLQCSRDPRIASFLQEDVDESMVAGLDVEAQPAGR
jgi:phospholipid/cholesterol/gamma-HCH transport system ATP-binding protein